MTEIWFHSVADTTKERNAGDEDMDELGQRNLFCVSILLKLLVTEDIDVSPHILQQLSMHSIAKYYLTVIKAF